MGLISLAVEDDELQAKALEVAVRLANGAPSAMRFTKYALNNWYRMAGPAFDASVALEMLGFTGPEVRRGWHPIGRNARRSSTRSPTPDRIHRSEEAAVVVSGVHGDASTSATAVSASSIMRA